MNQFQEGQRWASTPEPELGLGTVVQTTEDRVHLLYPATGELRLYAIGNAPLRRVVFQPGQEVEDHDGVKHLIKTVRDDNGVLTYSGQGWELPEAHLNDNMQSGGPMDRLLGGFYDDPHEFDLRRRALAMMHDVQQSPVRGFVGGRIDLIPHQLYIAHEVCNRIAPRVMLSDEVGLGKTIEAGLIVHRQRQTGRAARVLILVPENLLHQWFVEMLRKFNLWFNIFDEARCVAIQDTEPDANPFLDDQLILCSIDFLATDTDKAQLAVDAGWDLLVVDEAHHLEWSPSEVSREYEIVEALACKAEGLLLLTATPEQLGAESHLARLRLLDPDRYTDLSSLESESDHYTELAPIATVLSEGGTLSTVQKDRINALPYLDVSTMSNKELLSALLDRHGPGRVIFRNTRSAMSGFPKRVAHLVSLQPDNDHDSWQERARLEFASESCAGDPIEEYDFKRDPRIIWLGEFIQDRGGEKALLICSSKEKALALEEAIRLSIAVKCAVFHEDLTLVHRDRNAAWFAEEDGAQLLVCSEIGSEGRNFQFVHHLVLFDLPLNPELLEQRIGRLDRIGQKSTIQLHVPYLGGSPFEVLAQWYHEGLDAFEHNLLGANELMQQFGEEVLEICSMPSGEKDKADLFSPLLKRTVDERNRIAQKLEQGRDRLLELNSNNPETAAFLVDAIQTMDKDLSMESLLLDIFDCHGVYLEELGNRSYLFDNRKFSGETFPGLPKERMVGTFERGRALGRENISLFTCDHPIVTSAMDMLLGSETGNCSFGIWVDKNHSLLLLEVIFVLETLAPPRLHADRFLPSTPIHLLISEKKELLEVDLPELISGSPLKLLGKSGVTKKLIPSLMRVAQSSAEKKARIAIVEARDRMNLQLQAEIDRLEALRKVNTHVRDEEIDLARKQLDQLSAALGQARVRMDSMRLIWRGLPEDIGEA
jgi:ATP-dependent helicase HepA